MNKPKSADIGGYIIPLVLIGTVMYFSINAIAKYEAKVNQYLQTQDSLMTIYNDLSSQVLSLHELSFGDITFSDGIKKLESIDENTEFYFDNGDLSMRPKYDHPDSLRASIGRLERQLSLIHEEKQFQE